jgi:hypothetical protein
LDSGLCSALAPALKRIITNGLQYLSTGQLHSSFLPSTLINISRQRTAATHARLIPEPPVRAVSLRQPLEKTSAPYRFFLHRPVVLFLDCGALQSIASAMRGTPPRTTLMALDRRTLIRGGRQESCMPCRRTRYLAECRIRHTTFCNSDTHRQRSAMLA